MKGSSSSGPQGCQCVTDFGTLCRGGGAGGKVGTRSRGCWGFQAAVPGTQRITHGSKARVQPVWLCKSGGGAVGGGQELAKAGGAISGYGSAGAEWGSCSPHDTGSCNQKLLWTNVYLMWLLENNSLFVNTVKSFPVMTLLRAGKDASPVSFSFLMTVPSPQSTSSSAERAASNEGRVCQPSGGWSTRFGGPSSLPDTFHATPFMGSHSFRVGGEHGFPGATPSSDKRPGWGLTAQDARSGSEVLVLKADLLVSDLWCH